MRCTQRNKEIFWAMNVMKMDLWSIWLALALGATLTSITAISWLFVRLRELERNMVTAQAKT